MTAGRVWKRDLGRKIKARIKITCCPGIAAEPEEKVLFLGHLLQMFLAKMCIKFWTVGTLGFETIIRNRDIETRSHQRVKLHTLHTITSLPKKTCKMLCDWNFFWIRNETLTQTNELKLPKMTQCYLKSRTFYESALHELTWPCLFCTLAQVVNSSLNSRSTCVQIATLN